MKKWKNEFDIIKQHEKTIQRAHKQCISQHWYQHSFTIIHQSHTTQQNSANAYP